MILGVLSDTHGNHALLYRALDRMEQEGRPDTVVHLGDDYEDAEWLEASGFPVVKVPGLWCDAYRDRRIPKYALFTCEGVRVACAHTLDDIPASARKAELLLTGHTHHAAIEKQDRSLFVNPGHLRAPRDRGEAASFAIIDIGADILRVRIIGIDGVLRIAREYLRSDFVIQ
jgi:uncharacterized protein